MKSLIARAVAAFVAGLTALCAFIVAISGSVTAAVTLTATALIVPGTSVPNPGPTYMGNAVDYYVRPTTTSCATVCTPEPVPYLAQFWPFPWEGWGGLSGAKLDESVASGVAQLTSDLVGTHHPSADSPVVIFGYSQGATVATVEKYQLRKLSREDQGNINFVLIGNPNRPNGGLFERLAMFGTVPILDATFGLPTPTGTDMGTVDVAFQYDGVADFPLYPVNALADLNAIAGFWYTHGSYLAPDGSDPNALPNGLTPAELAAAIADPANQQRIPGSDTTYVLVPTPNLPLLQPLREFGAFTHTEFLTTALIDLIQPALKVLIETGYDRSLPYGRPAPFRLVPMFNPITVTADFVTALGQGVRAALRDLSGQAPAAPASTPAAQAVSATPAAQAVSAIGAPRPTRALAAATRQSPTLRSNGAAVAAKRAQATASARQSPQTRAAHRRP